jgi:hypothetical protein
VSIGDLRRTRYRGLAKTRLLHLIIATALNVHHVAAWLTERPRAQTPVSASARLARRRDRPDASALAAQVRQQHLVKGLIRTFGDLGRRWS